MNKQQALQKYTKATKLSFFRSSIKDWKDAFPDAVSLSRFRADVGSLSWPGSYGESPWEDAYDVAFVIGEGISPNTRNWLESNLTENWCQNKLVVYAAYGITL